MKPGQKARMNPNCISRIRLSLPASDLVLCFQRRPGLHCAKLAQQIWSGQPGRVLGQTDLIQKQAGVQESSGLVLVECDRPTTSFLLSDSGPFFHRWPGSHRTKLPQNWFGSGWLYQVSAKQIRSGSKLVYKNHWARFWPMLPATKPIRIGCKLDRHVYSVGTMTVKKRRRVAGSERGKRASCKERAALTGSKSGSLKGAGLCPRKNSSGVWNLRPMLRANCTQREKHTHTKIKQVQYNLLNNIKSTDWWKHTFTFKSNLPKHITLFLDSLVFAGTEELHTQFHASRVETG